MTLDGHTAIDEPAGGCQQPGGVGATSFWLETSPVERQRGEVVEGEPFLGQPLQLCSLLALDLVVGQRDEVEPDVAEEKLVFALRDHDLTVRERRSAGHHGQGHVRGPVLLDREICCHRDSSSNEPNPDQPCPACWLHCAKRLCAERRTASAGGSSTAPTRRSPSPTGSASKAPWPPARSRGPGRSGCRRGYCTTGRMCRRS